MKTDTDGSLEFVGEDQIDHPPKDEKVRALLGNAFDIVGERLQTNHRQIAERVSEDDFEIKLRNHKTEDIVATVIERNWGDWKIIQQSRQNTKKDAFTAEWQIPGVLGSQDYDSTIIATQRIKPFLNVGNFVTWDVTTLIVDWLADPASNDGLKIQAGK